MALLIGQIQITNPREWSTSLTLWCGEKARALLLSQRDARRACSKTGTRGISTHKQTEGKSKLSRIRSRPNESYRLAHRFFGKP